MRELLETVADKEVPPALVTTITRETSGNPFFIREVLLHLVEEGTLVHQGGRWSATVAVEVMRIPDTVRQVIERRLGRLDEPARRLLDVAALFTETVRFDIAAHVAGLEETAGLNALDEVRAAQLLKSTSDPHAYEFTHALVRHTLHGALNAPRRVRLHRQIAEAMERAYSADAERYSGEIAGLGRKLRVLRASVTPSARPCARLTQPHAALSEHPQAMITTGTRPGPRRAVEWELWSGASC